jgi:hypothetical protein
MVTMVGDNSNTEVKKLHGKRQNAIGLNFGEDNQIVVVGVDEEVGSKKYKVFCSVCSKDPEMFGEGIFLSALGSLKNSNIPCGCSKGARLTNEQYSIKTLRECFARDYTFLSVVGDWNGIYTRVLLRCNKDNFQWKVQLSKFFAGDGCNHCARVRIVASRTISDELMSEAFMASGKFVEGTTFSRSEKLTRHGQRQYFDTYCPICSTDSEVELGRCSGIFTSLATNLARGKHSCRCAPKTGFSKEKDGFVYVLSVIGNSHSFTGFGVTGYIEKRLRTHTRLLGDAGFTIEDYSVFPMFGDIAINVENSIKDKFPKFPQEVKGFITEATQHCYFNQVIAHVEDYIRGH